MLVGHYVEFDVQSPIVDLIDSPVYHEPVAHGARAISTRILSGSKIWSYIAAKLRQVVTYADGILVSGALRYVTIVTACTGPGPFKLAGLPLGGFADFSYVRHLFSPNNFHSCR